MATGSRARLRIERQREQFLRCCGTREPDEYHIRKAAQFLDEVKSPFVTTDHKDDPGRLMSRARHNLPGSARDGAGLHWLRLFADYDGDKCLVYPFATAAQPRGILHFNFKPIPAHRAMCLHVHKLPADETKTFALHSCGNGHLGCVNPKHLYWGDASQNAKDAAKHKSEGKQEIKQAPRPHYRGLEGRLRRSVAQAA